MNRPLLVCLVALALPGILSGCTSLNGEPADGLVHAVRLQSVEKAVFSDEAGAIHIDLRYEPADQDYPDVSCTLTAPDGGTHESPFSFSVLQPGLLRKHIRMDGGPDSNYSVHCRSGSTEVFGQVTFLPAE